MRCCLSTVVILLVLEMNLEHHTSQSSLLFSFLPSHTDVAKLRPQDLLLGCGGFTATLNLSSTSTDGQQDCAIFCTEGNNREAKTKKLPQWGFRDKALVHDLFIKHFKATPFRPFQKWFSGYLECFRVVSEFEGD